LRVVLDEAEILAKKWQEKREGGDFDAWSGALLQTLASPNEEVYGYFGVWASGIADTNVDGRGDVIVGTLAEDPGASPERVGLDWYPTAKSWSKKGESSYENAWVPGSKQKIGGRFRDAIFCVGPAGIDHHPTVPSTPSLSPP
jgi:hypothetical protein